MGNSCQEVHQPLGSYLRVFPVSGIPQHTSSVPFHVADFLADVRVS